MYNGDRVPVSESVSELIDSRSEYRCGEGAEPMGVVVTRLLYWCRTKVLVLLLSVTRDNNIDNY